MKHIPDELEQAVKNRDLSSVRDYLDSLPPAEIANLISDSPEMEAQALMFRCLPRKLAAHAFEYMPYQEQHELIKSLGNEEVAEVLNRMADDDRTKLLEELPSEATKKVLELLSEDERRSAIQLLGYPERQRRKINDSALHCNSPVSHGAAGLGLCSDARTRQRNADNGLCHKRRRTFD